MSTGTKITFMNGRDWISSYYVGEKVSYLGVSMVVIKRHCAPLPKADLPKEVFRDEMRIYEEPFVLCEFVDGHGCFQTKKFSGDAAMLLEGHGLLRSKP